MRRFVTILFGSAASVVAMTPAFAGPLTASTILQDFNAVIYTNASTQADIEGAAVIGGNFSGATVNNNPSGTPANGFGALTVYGNTTGNSINMNNGGNAYVAGNRGATINFNAGGGHAGGYTGAPGNTITDFKAPLNALSLSLSQLVPNSFLPAPTNNEVIQATPGANGIAVFSLTAADLAAIPSFNVNLNGASTVVFDVSGNVTFNANDESGTSGADNIIWNFYNATSVALNTQIGGTVLAPDALVTNNNQIDGALVADAWTGSGELHDWAFDGTLPSSVPEPASMAVLAVGLTGMGMLRRRRRSI